FGGALASGATMSSGAILQEVLSGGTASNTSLATGAYEVLFGSANGVNLVASSYEYVFSGATATNTTATGPIALQYVVAGGSATNNVISSGALEYVYGVASNTTMTAAGAQTLGYVFSGGAASNFTVDGVSGIAQVNVGGVLVGGSVTNSALEYILGSGSN